MASLIGRVEDLVVEDGEVQSETKSDWVGRGEISLSNFGSILVCLKRLVSGLLSLIASGEFGQISVVVALPVGPSVYAQQFICSDLTSCGRRPWTRRSEQT